jgi:hypothetical protein
MTREAREQRFELKEKTMRRLLMIGAAGLALSIGTVSAYAEGGNINNGSGSMYQDPLVLPNAEENYLGDTNSQQFVDQSMNGPLTEGRSAYVDPNGPLGIVAAPFDFLTAPFRPYDRQEQNTPAFDDQVYPQPAGPPVISAPSAD